MRRESKADTLDVSPLSEQIQQIQSNFGSDEGLTLDYVSVQTFPTEQLGLIVHGSCYFRCHVFCNQVHHEFEVNISNNLPTN